MPSGAATDPVEQDLAQRPKKLPGRPVFGTVKSPCPVCGEKTKHDKHAVCQSCGVPNRWLLDKWGLAPAVEYPPAAAAPVVEAAIVSDPSSVVTTPAPPVSEPEIAEAQIVEAPDPFSPPVSEPATTQIVAPAEAIEPAHITPNKQPVMLEMEMDREISALDELPQRPPKVGKLKTVCPHCRENSKHDKSAVCQNCGQLNELLAKRWGYIDPTIELRYSSTRYDTPLAPEEPEFTATTHDDLADLAPEPDMMQVEDLPLGLQVEPLDVEPEPEPDTGRGYEPADQGRGYEPEEPSRSFSDEPTFEPVQEVRPSVPVVTVCPSCHRRAVPDFYGHCALCGHNLEGGGD